MTIWYVVYDLKLCHYFLLSGGAFPCNMSLTDLGEFVMLCRQGSDGYAVSPLLTFARTLSGLPWVEGDVEVRM